MRKLVFVFLTMFFSSFVFSTNIDHSSIESSVKNFITTYKIEESIIDYKIKKVSENLSSSYFATCQIEIDLINGSTGEVVGTLVLTTEISGGSEASQQFTCEFLGQIITSLLNAGL